ncbi:AraC family transcriptional regulator [Sphingorhabdus sp. 109]|jgi:AraC-like DNA-binding protein|uniref:AraC family transcriptional regulator n=1 Tax=Sphingorhabdus sp. 109 TaxID=2653173 RepID=UPI0012F1CFB9|nr:AraC family transcriptional regulator [Sphingorhabdus sp. 109]VWX56796.1 Transcriptional regulator, AraC family [Sphingorhabdus sp. 109]
MSKQQIRDIIENRVRDDGMVESGISGVKLFRATEAIPCAPVVYEPCVIAIVSGSKEAALDGRRLIYDDSRYLCCPMSMPVEAGTPRATPDNPLYGAYISLDPRMMTELAVEMENAEPVRPAATGGREAPAIGLARWDDDFMGSLLRLLQLGHSEVDIAVLGKSRLRELYFAVLKGEAGYSARQAFGVGNAIARSIAHVSSQLSEPISVEDLATRAGMSRAVFHRKFKSATTMSPVQFVKSMRLNNAALKIAAGMPVSQAAMEVGYVSSSQFSREFKRLYGESPRQWSEGEIALAKAI